MSFPDQDYTDILAQRCHGSLNCKTLRCCLEKQEWTVYHFNSVLEQLRHVYAECTDLFWIFGADFQGESGLGNPGFVYKRVVNGFRISQFPCLNPMKCSSWVFVCFSTE